MVPSAVKTAEILSKHGINSTVINARFLRPLDQALIHPLARRIGKIVTMEEGSLAGGFGAAVVESLIDQDLLIPTYRIGIPDKLIHHASPDQSKEELGLTPDQMANNIFKRFGFKSDKSISLSTTTQSIEN